MKPGPKLMHDANAGEDFQVRRMLKRFGAQGYGCYWRVNERLRTETGYRMDSQQEGFWAELADHCYCTEEFSREWIGAMLDSYRLYVSDGRYIWSERVKRDAEEYDWRTKRKSLGGTQGAATRYGKEYVKDGLSILPRHVDGASAAVNQIVKATAKKCGTNKS